MHILKLFLAAGLAAVVATSAQGTTPEISVSADDESASTATEQGRIDIAGDGARATRSGTSVVKPIPEPATVLLPGLGLIALARATRRR